MIIARRLRGLSAAVGFFATLVALDWLPGSPRLPALLPGLASMKFATAAMLALVALGTWLALAPVPRTRAAQLCGAVVLASALAFLAGFPTPRHHLLLAPSPATSALCFLLGSALLVRLRAPRAAAAALALGALIGYAGVLGYLVGHWELYRFGPFSSMAIHTAFCGLVLAAVLAVEQPGLPVARLARDPGDAGATLRLLLPAVLGIPAAMALLLRVTTDLRAVSPVLDIAFVMALFAALMVIGATALAARLYESDRQRAQAREAQAASERLTAEILYAVPSAVLVVDDAGVIVRANAHAATLFGTSSDELGGRSVEDLVPSHLRAEHAHQRAAYQLAPRPRTMGDDRQFHARRLDGSEFPVNIGLSPVTIGGLPLVVVSVIDISDRLETERRLREYAQGLERSNRELEQFAFIASHDLQEPLRAIEGFSERLGETYADVLDERGRHWLDLTTDGARRMRALVHDLLGYSRVRTRDLEIERIDLAEVLRVALADIAPLAEEQEAAIEWQTLPLVDGDATLLRLLLRNLLVNALRYRSDAPPRIHLSAQWDANRWEIAVADNGIGIESRDFERIFMVFKRLHTRRDKPGNGMGLAMCRSIVERHGGRIRVESRPGHGSTFYFTLPGPAPL